MAENKSDDTNYQFKLLYALGMLFIVSGHAAYGGSYGGLTFFSYWFPPYGFHVELFAFCSGYLYKHSSEDHVLQYMVKKVKTLIIPLYLWNFVYAGIVSLLALRGFTIGGKVTPEKLFLMPIWNGHQFEYNLGGWFVISLFLIEIFNIILRKLIPLKGNAKEIVIFVIYFILGLLGNYAAIKGYNTYWWLVPTRMLHFIPFFGLGSLYKNVLEKYDKLPGTYYFAIIMTIQLGIICILGRVPAYTPSWCNNFADGPFMPILYGTVAIAFWLRISRVLTPLLGRNKVVLAVANSSYSIMINQFLGFMLVKACFAAANRILGVAYDFDWALYKTDIWYYYIPRGLAHIGILYIIAGLALPVLIQSGINFVKRKH